MPLGDHDLVAKQIYARRTGMQVTLSRNGKRFVRNLHRLVALDFIPNPLGLPEVNHKSNKADCRAVKLEWRSKAGNVLDVVQRELRGQGIDFSKALGKWRVRIKQKHLGYYTSKRKALSARRAAVKKLPKVI